MVGDGAVGKTSLLITYTYKRFRLWPTFYNSTVNVMIHGDPLTLQLFDTAGTRQADTYCVPADQRLSDLLQHNPASFENVKAN